MSIAIRKNHPVKEVVSRRARVSKYPFGEMSPGDSFKLPLSDFISDKNPTPTFEYARNLIRTAGAVWRSRNPQKPLFFKFGTEDGGKSIAVEAYLKS